MIIDWKEEENYSKRSKLIIMNNSENDISDHKFTIVPLRKRLKTNTHLFIDEAYKRVDCAILDKPTTGTMTTLLKEELLD